MSLFLFYRQGGRWKQMKWFSKGCTESLFTGQGLNPSPQRTAKSLATGFFFFFWVVKWVIVNNPEWFVFSFDRFKGFQCHLLVLSYFIRSLLCIFGWKPSVPQFPICSFYVATYLPSHLCIVSYKCISNLKQCSANPDTGVTRGDCNSSAPHGLHSASVENLSSPRNRSLGVWDYFQEPSLSIHQE